jgi:hypothetical protein
MAGVKDALLKPIITLMKGIKKVAEKLPDFIGDPAEEAIDRMLNAFKKGEDEAVGHSIIPDMVDKIALTMNKLPTVMGDPARDAADAVNDSFKSMASSVSGSIKGMIQGTTSLKDALRSIGGKISDKFIWNPLDKAIGDAIGGIDFGFGGGSLPSMSGGGFTGGGARSGGVDGKGGFPAILHPNETVTDHTKGGGQTIVVNYSPQVNALDPRTAQMVIAQNAPTIVGVIRQAFNRNGQAVAI